jgi:beta-1,3-galactosyltransferase 1
MKCDDDSFVNIPNLIHVLLGGTVPLYNEVLKYRLKDRYKAQKYQFRINHTEHLIMGRFVHNHPVNRDSNYLWYVPRYMMSNDIFPDYVSGIGYVMAFESVKVLFAQSIETPILYLEDAYMTGVVAELAQIPRTPHPLFNWDLESNCSMRGMVCLHHYKFNEIVKTYNFITNSSEKCGFAPSEAN